MGKIILLLRVPFIDMIPSLKTLVIYLTSKGYQITIISSQADNFSTLGYKSANINIKLVKERSHRLGIPTSIKLFFACFFQIIRIRPVWLIAGDGTAASLLCTLSRIVPINYIDFLLEYPEPGNKNEYKSMKRAKHIITHDRWHLDFILHHFDIDENKFLLLPNASHTPPYNKSSDYLARKLNVAGKRIILHSGGLGEWFYCKELAQATEDWKGDTLLVFHTSHRVEDTPYYKEMSTILKERQNVVFSTTPVSNEELDELVASAYIGIAFYSVSKLGFRAKYMGLAAGKIGNYLKCGVPVIATRLPSLSYIEEYQCGTLVDDVSEVKEAINLISRNRTFYSANAHRCYNELWEPSRYLETIYATISEHK